MVDASVQKSCELTFSCSKCFPVVSLWAGKDVSFEFISTFCHVLKLLKVFEKWFCVRMPFGFMRARVNAPGTHCVMDLSPCSLLSWSFHVKYLKPKQISGTHKCARHGIWVQEQTASLSLSLSLSRLWRATGDPTGKKKCNLSSCLN